MSEIVVVVEGQTEQTFIREVLAPWLAPRGVYLHPALIGKPGQKGGDIRFERAKFDIGMFLKQRSTTFITTMFDYYRIESTWPGRERVQKRSFQGASLYSQEKAAKLEQATSLEIGKAFPDYNPAARFLPYIIMHEFEALLFCGPQEIESAADINRQHIEQILTTYPCPEDINDHPTLHHLNAFLLCSPDTGKW